jgi:hypothetical protein
MAEPMHIRYAKAFSNLSLGRALYHPCPKSTLHLGVCGYFDHQGDWKTIVDIVEMDLTAAPAGLKLTSLNPVPSVAPPSVSQWDPICSKNVAYEKLENTAQVGYDIIYIANDRTIGTVREGFKFTKSKDFGAVLVTQGDVKEEYYTEDTPFHDWINDNYKAIRSSYPDVFKSNIPLWIIDKIYYTSQCSIWCWEGEQREVSLQIGVNALESAPGDVTGNISTSSVHTTGPGWAHYGSSRSDTLPVFLWLLLR